MRYGVKGLRGWIRVPAEDRIHGWYLMQSSGVQAAKSPFQVPPFLFFHWHSFLFLLKGPRIALAQKGNY